MTKAGLILGRISICLALSALAPATALAAAGPTRMAAVPGSPSANPFCGRLGKTIQASSGAQMYCFGPQRSFGAARKQTLVAPMARLSGLNVDAANFNEDISPAGVRAYGQSETSIAGVDNYVVESWNDSTAFFSACPSAGYKQEATGVGFSADGGKTFADLGGLPNDDCLAPYGGDPSVQAYKTAAGDFFYISSLYNNSITGVSYIALAACQAVGSGSSSSLYCGQPIRVAQSSVCKRFTGFTACNFLDKDFLTIDPKRGKLYAAYSEFSYSGIDSGRSELAVCDIGSTLGAAGPAGGTAAAPVCPQGAILAPSPAAQPKPYLVLSTDTTCENEGNYPDVDKRTGDVYDAWEYNWATNYSFFPCLSRPTTEQVVRVPENCLKIAAQSPCSAPARTNAVAITSMDVAFIPGYSRFPMNDFPRIAVSERYGTVSLVWNDSRYRPTGDILLESFKLGSLAPVQFTPTRLGTNKGATWAFLPSLRNEDQNGNLNVAWYDRRLSPPNNFGGAGTDVYAALAIAPTATTTPANVRITNYTSNWNAASSDITPNFGDYTDNYVITNPASPTGTGSKLYVAWSDGRYADPQPFESNLFIH